MQHTQNYPHNIPSSRQYPDPQHFRDLERLGEEITQLAAHIHAATFQLLELIREFNEQEGWAGEGVNSCAHWLNWKCGMNLGAARERVRVAHALPELPLISAVFREGKVSYSKVRATWNGWSASSGGCSVTRHWRRRTYATHSGNFPGRWTVTACGYSGVSSQPSRGR